MQANLWPDEQKPHIRLSLGIRPRDRSKSNSYTELAVVDAAGRWRERNVWYPGRFCTKRSERGNRDHEATLNVQKSAEAIVAER